MEPSDNQWRLTNGDGTVVHLVNPKADRTDAQTEADQHNVADAYRQKPYRWWLVVAPDTPLRFHHCWRIRWSDVDAIHTVDFRDWKKAMTFYTTARLDHASARMTRVVGKKARRD